MSRVIKLGILCLENSPLLNLFEIFCAEFPLPSNAEIHIIQAAKRVSDAGIERFRYRTHGAFDNRKRISALQFPVSFVDSHIHPDTIDGILELDLDLGLNFGTHATLTPSLLNAFPMGVLNCHPGELPRYRGSCSPEWALFNGDPLYSTLHFMDYELDTGPILSKLEIRKDILFTYFEFRSLLLWSSVFQPFKWISHLSQNSKGELRAVPTGEKQGVGKFWGPIPDDLLTKVVESHRRTNGSQIEMLLQKDIKDWIPEFALE